MARFCRLDVLHEILRIGVVPIFYDADGTIVRSTVAACAEGGATAFEFVNRGDNAFRVFSDLVSHFSKALPSLMLGAGSIVDPTVAGLYIACGANFVVGPTFNPEVAKVCNRHKVPYIPGCSSASEISEAEESGVEIVKTFFRDPLAGPATVSVIHGPMPWTRILQSGCVELAEESFTRWFSAGVSAVGLGSALFQSGPTKPEDYCDITARMTRAVELVQRARGEKVFEGVDHICLCATSEIHAQEIARWYADLFGWHVQEDAATYVVEGGKPGRLEVCLDGSTTQNHVAVRVASLDLALEMLKARGIELEVLQEGTGTRMAQLKQTDPAGNRVHLVWRR